MLIQVLRKIYKQFNDLENDRDKMRFLLDNSDLLMISKSIKDCKITAKFIINEKHFKDEEVQEIKNMIFEI